MSTQTYIGTLVVQDCPNCGMQFGVPADYDKRRQDDHQTFYCPSGHGQSYTGKSEAQKLRGLLANANRRIEWAETGLRAARDQAETSEYRRRAEKAAKTRLKNRIANGVCPCCNRSFQDLRRHMAGRHPNYTEGGKA